MPSVQDETAVIHGYAGPTLSSAPLELTLPNPSDDNTPSETAPILSNQRLFRQADNSSHRQWAYS